MPGLFFVILATIDYLVHCCQCFDLQLSKYMVCLWFSCYHGYQVPLLEMQSNFLLSVAATSCCCLLFLPIKPLLIGLLTSRGFTGFTRRSLITTAKPTTLIYQRRDQQLCFARAFPSIPQSMLVRFITGYCSIKQCTHVAMCQHP